MRTFACIVRHIYMLKILTVNCCYKIWSTGKIIKDIEEVLKDAEFYQVFEHYGIADGPRAYRLSNDFMFRIYLAWSRITGRRYDTGLIPALKTIRIIKKVNPDVVHLHCPNSGSLNLFYVLEYLKKHKVKTVITNHAEFYYTGTCPHANECNKYLTGCGKCPDIRKSINSYFLDRTHTLWKKMYKALHGFDDLTMVAVSPWQLKRMESSPITKDLKKEVVFNGLDTSVFYYRENAQYVRKQYNIPEDKKVILHVTAHFTDFEDDPKGGVYFIKMAEDLLNEQDCIFVVAGNYDIKNIGDLPTNLILLGSIDNQDTLSALYSVADVTVITSKRETFGMSCAESLCCGTPVIGFCCGGAESVSLIEYSSFVEQYGDINQLKIEMNDMLKFSCSGKIKREISREAVNCYSKERMASCYEKLYLG